MIVDNRSDRRMGLAWCDTHKQALMFCDDPVCVTALEADVAGQDGLDLHNWHAANAVRKYAGLMTRGKSHPFRMTGGRLHGYAEDPAQVTAAVHAAKTKSVPLHGLLATKQATPQHLHLLLRRQAPEPRTGNHPLESADHPTVIRCGPSCVIADGLHRLTAAWAKGQTSANVRVVDGLTPTFDNSASLLLRPDET